MIQKLKARANSKKGFTLAELLVVVAIIAVLVAIAIPTFSAATKKAQLAVDDANIRNGYAIFKMAQLTGGVDTGSGAEYPTTSTTYYLYPDGSVGTSEGSAYKLQAAETPCGVTTVAGSTITHVEGAVISITGYGSSWTFSVAKK